ncbi:type II/III secretion system family protein [Paraburkholderia sp. Ac-20340]|uniref:secretin N-terminal domain-containing protein n=1 Tax=Paraburkholderia sp. Ac-20340 TaxID=2703888 RepID=UPI00197CCE0C|nr:secretin N-terminal domain-containing protein [Paraburkholderia sp. Ac-20340]MBN3853192.1 type II/III secretion system family protein [Paraburkholderia sp. Ac-20340]
MSARTVRRALKASALSAWAAFACVAASNAANAANVANEPGWRAANFDYTAARTPLADVLRDFGAAGHVNVRVSAELAARGARVSGRFAMPASRFLATLAASYGLVWYYDGALLHVSSAAAQTRLAIHPDYLRAEALANALTRAGVIDARFALDVEAASGIVSVYGPPDYVARVRAAAARFEADARAAVPTSVRVFRLNVASAADQSHVVDGRVVSVPGVATRLRMRLHGGVASSDDAIHFESPLPIVQADARTNSILVRDRPARIDADGALVADLDVKPTLFALQMLVVEVPRERLAALQVDGASAPKPLAQADARTLTTQLEALAQHGEARIEIARTALTVDGAPAFSERHEARLVSLSGKPEQQEPADAARWWLSVAPTMADVNARRIALDIELRDADGSADATPHRHAELNAGDALVMTGAGADASTRRVIVLVPRVAA